MGQSPSRPQRTFSNILAMERAKRGFSVKEVSNQSGLSDSRIRTFERGEDLPTVPELSKLFRAFPALRHSLDALPAKLCRSIANEVVAKEDSRALALVPSAVAIPSNRQIGKSLALEIAKRVPDYFHGPDVFARLSSAFARLHEAIVIQARNTQINEARARRVEPPPPPPNEQRMREMSHAVAESMTPAQARAMVRPAPPMPPEPAPIVPPQKWESFGARLLAERLRARVNQTELATILGCSGQAIGSWERNDASPSAHWYHLLLEYFPDLKHAPVPPNVRVRRVAPPEVAPAQASSSPVVACGSATDRAVALTTDTKMAPATAEVSAPPPAPVPAPATTSEPRGALSVAQIIRARTELGAATNLIALLRAAASDGIGIADVLELLGVP